VFSFRTGTRRSSQPVGAFAVSRPDQVCVHVVQFVEAAEVAECAVDVVGVLWLATRKDISLSRYEQRARRVREGPKNGLAANDDDVGVTRPLGAGANDVLQVLAPHILAARLADVRSSGLVTKRELPPPTAVTVYELTAAGRELGPTLAALSGWGEQYGTPINQSQVARPQWILTSIARHHPNLLAGRSCELRVGRDAFELSGDGTKLSIAAGAARSPDAMIGLELDAFYRLATNRITTAKARGYAVLAGDPAIATDVLGAISGATAG
jgi:hypothetical protein